MMCAATVNWTLIADTQSPTAYVMFISTIRMQGFCAGLPGVYLHRTQQDYFRIAE
jgi:hypothetical protein